MCVVSTVAVFTLLTKTWQCFLENYKQVHPTNDGMAMFVATYKQVHVCHLEWPAQSCMLPGVLFRIVPDSVEMHGLRK